jgi:hypothetical protein
MVMKKIKYLLLIFIVASFVYSCKKIQQISGVPQIEFRNFSIFDTTDILGNISKGGRLRFRFEDGDGDVGLDNPKSGQTDSTNLFLTLYRIKNGERVAAKQDDPIFPSAYRIPYMERLGRDKIIKGTISVTFLYLFYSPGDTIAYDFYIEDRALNQSNVASTTDIVISQNKIYK